MEQSWIDVLTNWPDGIARKGIAITTAGDSIEFCSYMLSGPVLLLERERPDSHGGRRVMLQLSQLAAVKILDPIEIERFREFGFEVPTPS